MAAKKFKCRALFMAFTQSDIIGMGVSLSDINEDDVLTGVFQSKDDGKSCILHSALGMLCI